MKALLGVKQVNSSTECLEVKSSFVTSLAVRLLRHATL